MTTNIDKRFVSLVIVLMIAITTLFAEGWAAITLKDAQQVTVHEWGTFTSIAGGNGEAVMWRSYSPPADLPCFVNRGDTFKGSATARVRMETPVLYFYSPTDATADIKVTFPKGALTEWYPKAVTSSGNDSLEWRNVKITPHAVAEFPGGAASHYYAARKTDAAPLEVQSQKEKFLFYRGVGNFAPPIAATVSAAGDVVVKNLGFDPHAAIILFENRDGHRRYRLLEMVNKEVAVKPDSLRSDWETASTDLERVLTEQGLYPREARAMINTWRDSWFEEGTRVFYIVPKSFVDSVLPLNIQPIPSEIARVFVGRMEIVTPWMEDAVRQAVASEDGRALAKWGRFLEPITQRLNLKSPLLNRIFNDGIAASATCAR